ncbi:hypothetical protein [Hyphomonas sp.]|uniref:PD-(D/E)XK nuclease domain-containing protein n=1 Tax=Hyphomonas sp. TaxID=87 RepID=UPI0025C43E21|nr:hypothetical protein [Hyphomonas sp.]
MFSMTEFRLSRGLCAIVGDSLSGSHATLDALFISSGAPGDPPDLAHHSKWKEWLFRAGQDPDVDSLRVLGNILEEFMDVEPVDEDSLEQWKQNRERVEKALSDNGLEYYQGGRVIPNGGAIQPQTSENKSSTPMSTDCSIGPNSVEDLLAILVRGLPRAMYPLSHRRKGAESLTFSNEYDVQDLLHAMLRPWVADVRAEEFTPSYAGASTRMDFLLPGHSTVIETKFVRNGAHAKRIGDELIIDIAHYAAHPDCKYLWCVVYDPDCLIKNVGGLMSDLEGDHSIGSGRVSVRVVIV